MSSKWELRGKALENEARSVERRECEAPAEQCGAIGWARKFDKE
jgi:hypothetical protein